MNYFETEEFKAAALKFDTLSSLGVLAQDHLAIGSTPPKELRENPDKTLGQLMTDEQIAEWISGNEKTIKKFSEMEPNDFINSTLPNLKSGLELGKKYLQSIGRLQEI